MDTERVGRKRLMGPITSRKFLLEIMESSGGLSIGEALELEQKENLFFGPDGNVVDVLIDKQIIGQIRFDKEAQKFIKVEPVQPSV